MANASIFPIIKKGDNLNIEVEAQIKALGHKLTISSLDIPDGLVENKTLTVAAE